MLFALIPVSKFLHSISDSLSQSLCWSGSEHVLAGRVEGTVPAVSHCRPHTGGGGRVRRLLLERGGMHNCHRYTILDQVCDRTFPDI